MYYTCIRGENEREYGDDDNVSYYSQFGARIEKRIGRRMHVVLVALATTTRL